MSWNTRTRPGGHPEGPREQTSASRKKVLYLLVDQARWSFGWERGSGPREQQERGQDGCLAEESGVSAPRLLEGEGGDQVGPLVRERGGRCETLGAGDENWPA